MPFSAVVVGVGDGNFQDMQVLDADAEVLTDPEGRKAVRDIVQLVEYEEFRELGMRELALEVLGEVPDQFVDYTVMMDSEVERKRMYQGSGKQPRKKSNQFVTPIKIDQASSGFGAEIDDRYQTAAEKPFMGSGNRNLELSANEKYASEA